MIDDYKSFWVGFLAGFVGLLVWCFIEIYIFDNGYKYKCSKCGEIIIAKDFNKKTEYYEKSGVK